MLTTTQRVTNRSLACVWILTDKGLSCIWIEREAATVSAIREPQSQPETHRRVA